MRGRKKKGLQFYCSTQPNKEGMPFVIGNIKAYPDVKERDNQASYNGPDFDDLDETLQQNMEEYLGIVACFANVWFVLFVFKEKNSKKKILQPNWV